MIIRKKTLNYKPYQYHILYINLIYVLYFAFIYYLVTISFDKGIALNISVKIMLPMYVSLFFITNLLLIPKKSIDFSYYIVNCIANMYLAYEEGFYINISKFEHIFSYLYSNIIVPVIIAISIFGVLYRLFLLKKHKI